MENYIKYWHIVYSIKSINVFWREHLLFLKSEGYLDKKLNSELELLTSVLN